MAFAKQGNGGFQSQGRGTGESTNIPFGGEGASCLFIENVDPEHGTTVARGKFDGQAAIDAITQCMNDESNAVPGSFRLMVKHMRSRGDLWFLCVSPVGTMGVPRRSFQQDDDAPSPHNKPQYKDTNPKKNFKERYEEDVDTGDTGDEEQEDEVKPAKRRPTAKPGKVVKVPEPKGKAASSKNKARRK